MPLFGGATTASTGQNNQREQRDYQRPSKILTPDLHTASPFSVRAFSASTYLAFAHVAQESHRNSDDGDEGRGRVEAGGDRADPLELFGHDFVGSPAVSKATGGRSTVVTLRCTERTTSGVEP